MTIPLPNRLSTYVTTLRKCDEILRLRVVLHDFGLVWQDARDESRSGLVTDEPEPVDSRWDAFLAADVELFCERDGVDPPAWVHNEDRFLSEFWFAGGCFEFDRQRTIGTTPAAFRKHGIWYPAEELLVV